MTLAIRFAPSPTGPLHLGHAYSALLAYDMAVAGHDRFLLRIEDTDIARARPQWEKQIYEDLRWLGLVWETPVLRQSDHLARYANSLTHLETQGLLYPCSCTRGDIRAALSAPQEGVRAAAVYPGTCRNRPMSSRQPGDALRLDLGRALDHLTKLPEFTETGPARAGHHILSPERMLQHTGDAVLGRKEIETVSYVLAAVIDDAKQQITTVIRGEDLYETTFLQILLQALLGLPTPTYHHHKLIRDASGKRLAKRDDARAIAKYHADGATPHSIRTLLDL